MKKSIPKPTKKKPPKMYGEPMESTGPFYAGAQIHWIDKKGKLRHTDRFPKKSEVMTTRGFKKKFQTK